MDKKLHAMTFNHQCTNLYIILSGKAIRTEKPEKIRALGVPSWRYRSIAHLATSGLYTQKDLDTLREHIMHGPERDAIMSIMSRGYSGRDPDHQGGSINYL